MIRDRERILDLFEYLCGARLLYNYIWVGGVSHDLPEKFIRRTKEFIDYFTPQIDEFDQLLTYNKIFIERTADVGILPPDVAINYGVTGPSLRGSGVSWDLRKDEPYAVYPELEFNVPVGTGKLGTAGDCWDRYYVRVLEMRESVKIIDQALKKIPDGDSHAAIPKKVRPPKRSVYSRFESDRGEGGY